MSTISLDEIKQVAQLANLTISDQTAEAMQPQIDGVIHYMSKIQAVDTSSIPETTQVTGLTNVFREDIIDSSRTLTQEEALSNATHTYKGYFVVDAVLES